MKVDKAMFEYSTKLSDFHAQFRGIGTNYNQVVKELRCHFSEKKAMALLYKLEKHTIDLVKLSREIVELSREMYASGSNQDKVDYMASIKVKFRPSSTIGKEGTIYYQIIHKRVIRQLRTDYRIYADEWDEGNVL